MLLTTRRLTLQKLWGPRIHSNPLTKRNKLSLPPFPRHLASKSSASAEKPTSHTSDTNTSKAPTPPHSLATPQSWNDEWKQLGLGARLPPSAESYITNLLFVQTGFGVDQHGNRMMEGATQAAVRAVRNAIEFNSIPGVIEAVPGGREEMLIHVLLGVPPSKQSRQEASSSSSNNVLKPMAVDLDSVAKVFPYGRLLPIQVQVGGLAFPTGRIVKELGDEDDMAVCVAACVSIGYDNGKRSDEEGKGVHTTYSTEDGF